MLHIQKHPPYESDKDIGGWFTDTEGVVYQQLVADIYQGHVLEIGNYHGLSLSYIFDMCRDRGNVVYCVDRRAHLEFRKNLIDWGNIDTVVTIVKSSWNARDCFEDRFFDLIFIDGSHLYEDVKNDLLGYLPKLKCDGVMAGHDYQCESVQRATAEILGSDIQVVGKIWIWRGRHAV